MAAAGVAWRERGGAARRGWQRAAAGGRLRPRDDLQGLVRGAAQRLASARGDFAPAALGGRGVSRTARWSRRRARARPSRPPACRARRARTPCSSRRRPPRRRAVATFPAGRAGPRPGGPAASRARRGLVGVELLGHRERRHGRVGRVRGHVEGASAEASGSSAMVSRTAPTISSMASAASAAVSASRAAAWAVAAATEARPAAAAAAASAPSGEAQTGARARGVRRVTGRPVIDARARRPVGGDGSGSVGSAGSGTAGRCAFRRAGASMPPCRTPGPHAARRGRVRSEASSRGAAPAAWRRRRGRLRAAVSAAAWARRRRARAWARRRRLLKRGSGPASPSRLRATPAPRSPRAAAIHGAVSRPGATGTAPPRQVGSHEMRRVDRGVVVWRSRRALQRRASDTLLVAPPFDASSRAPGAASRRLVSHPGWIPPRPAAPRAGPRQKGRAILGERVAGRPPPRRRTRRRGPRSCVCKARARRRERAPIPLPAPGLRWPGDRRPRRRGAATPRERGGRGRLR